MTNLNWKINVKYTAEELLRELGITKLPVCPFHIADKLDIEVRALPPNQKSVSGMLLRYDNQYGIYYATYLNNEGFQRFSISHEIGHYCIPGHPESILIQGVHESHAGFVSNDQYEKEADYFAANLLMPSFIFSSALDHAGKGLEAIKKLSKCCNTSLTATAIRFVEHAQDSVAIVVSNRNKVDFCFMSKSMRELDSIQLLCKGDLVPRSSLTHSFSMKSANIFETLWRDSYTNIKEWFGVDHGIELLEEVEGLGRSGRTLTVLSIS